MRKYEITINYANNNFLDYISTVTRDIILFSGKILSSHEDHLDRSQSFNHSLTIIAHVTEDHTIFKFYCSLLLDNTNASASAKFVLLYYSYA